eukprot:TRINITY_DN6914_c0_g1_i16.p2 TRINITY_DN6914_c0_g1~~TRINITY_DN6914_c0_g1_i16.p2  ORF type:complete len:203 (+),score=41.76 TRINITY_DN6914_c0_g1_i16:117-725(+)
MINTSKNFNTYESEGICVKEYAYYEDINATYKPAMEDGYILEDDILGDDVHGLFGILDGHGGRQVVEHCVSAIPTAFLNIRKKNSKMTPEELLKEVFMKVDDQLRLVGATETGSTACVVYVVQEGGKKVLYVANIGDTRAVMCSNGGVATRLSYDDKGSDPAEQERVKAAGGVILKNRVNGQLAVTRAFGNIELKKHVWCFG